MNKFKNHISIFFISIILFFNTATLTLAEDTPLAPTPPPAPAQDSIPKAPDAPLAPTTPDSPSTNTKSESPTPSASPKDEASPSPSNQPTSNPSSSPQNPQIVTSDNNNPKSNPTLVQQTTEIANSGNGSESTNNSTSTTSKDNLTSQNNNATVQNSPVGLTSTGSNTSSQNTGGNNSLTTGDANTSATVINALNTNVAGVAVSEFNIADNHTGDIVLDFTSPCTSSCAQKNILTNQGNGSGSTNNASSSANSSSDTFQKNDASVGNNITLGANSGNNVADQNTGGDTAIITGDANLAANVVTFANNNIAGNVIFGVVNIFGDLVGNIILSEESLKALGLNSCSDNCSPSTSIQNTGNGSESTNSAIISDNNSNSTFQKNDASIQNNLVFNTETGGNITKDNTGGDSAVMTGEANTSASVLNIANSNIASGDTWWLVIVNKAGKWIGKILGSPDGSTMAGSTGTEFEVDDKGQVTASKNSGNGSNSDNQTTSSTTTSALTSQNNTADVKNNINLSANTGQNTASENTGGNSTIQTGNANIIANIVNFVNNNIIGNGKLVVTLVNVFGSWAGNFVPPGQTASSTSAQGNVTEQPTVTPSPTTIQQVTENTDVYSDYSPVSWLSQPSEQTNYSYTYHAVGISQPSSPQLFYTHLSPQVAGIKTAQATEPDQMPANTLTLGDNTNNSKVIHLNLAWLVIIIPTGLLIYMLRRRKLKQG